MNTIDTASEWKSARTLYPIYSALIREFVIDVPSCQVLDEPLDIPDGEILETARRWFGGADERIAVHQLRQFLQRTTLVNDNDLQVLLEHYLRNRHSGDAYRDKLDFLLVQYFSHCAPSRLEDADVDLAYVSQVLEPVLGNVDTSVPEWLSPLEEMVRSGQACGTLSELLRSGVLDKGHRLKAAAGENYFQPAAMVAFTRFSFLMRRVFFRLMLQELNAIIDGLRELESRGVNALDCRRAQFSAEEPTARLRMICQSWKVMFHAEYSSGQPLRILVDLRAAVDAALAKAPANSTRENAGRAKSAVAGASFTSGTQDPAEFEVSSAPAWKPESGDSGQGD
jgi:hypothetical protein